MQSLIDKNAFKCRTQSSQKATPKTPQKNKRGHINKLKQFCLYALFAKLQIN